jgi:hypothetical protein
MYTEFEFSENKFSKEALNVYWKARRIESHTRYS